jgi:hypothetical protein
MYALRITHDHARLHDSSFVDACEQTLGSFESIDDLKFLDRAEAVAQKHPDLNADQLQQLYGEYQQENMLLDLHVEQHDLAAYYTELLTSIRG